MSRKVKLHPLEQEITKLENALDALEACPPLWWADKLLWRGLRWFYCMRLRRVKKFWAEMEKAGTAGNG